MKGWFQPTVPLAWHDAEMARERARYDTLFATIAPPGTRLAVSPRHAPVLPNGASEVPRETPPAPQDEFRELIDAKCGADYRKRALMLRQLAADRSAGVPREDILAAIEYGVGSRGVPNG